MVSASDDSLRFQRSVLGFSGVRLTFRCCDGLGFRAAGYPNPQPKS